MSRSNKVECFVHNQCSVCNLDECSLLDSVEKVTIISTTIKLVTLHLAAADINKINILGDRVLTTLTRECAEFSIRDLLIGMSSVLMSIVSHEKRLVENSMNEEMNSYEDR